MNIKIMTTHQHSFYITLLLRTCSDYLKAQVGNRRYGIGVCSEGYDMNYRPPTTAGCLLQVRMVNKSMVLQWWLYQVI